MRGQAHEFTKEEIKYIVDNWGKESPHSMKKKLGCTWYAISKVATLHGLELPTSNKWTEEEIKQAEDLFKTGKNYLEIAKTINRSEWAVANLLRNMGYSYMLPQFWKEEELKYLRENYENMTYAEIAEALGRTTKAIGAKAEELGYQKRLKRTKNKGGESNG